MYIYMYMCIYIYICLYIHRRILCHILLFFCYPQDLEEEWEKAPDFDVKGMAMKTNPGGFSPEISGADFWGLRKKDAPAGHDIHFE